MAKSNCCAAGLIEEVEHHSVGPRTYTYVCNVCDKPCIPYPNENCALYLFEDGKHIETRFPKVLRELSSNGQKPLILSFGEHSLSKNNAEEDEYKLWVVKCKLQINPTALKLEVGKQYVRRDGEVSGIMHKNSHHLYVFKDKENNLTYTSSGRQSAAIDTKYDLISEACIDSGTGTTLDPIQQMQGTSIDTPQMMGQLPIDVAFVKSKAKSDKVGTGLVLIPWYSILAVGKIFIEGLRYGKNNWKKGVNDKDYQEERLEHAMLHLLKWKEGDRTEEHLAKVAWFCLTQLELERLENESKTN